MNEIVRQDEAGSLTARLQFARALADASLLPPAYRKSPANVLLAMEYGRALGIDTMTAIQQVHVIEGKPTASAALIGGLVRRAGHRLRVSGSLEEGYTATIVRKDDPEFTFSATWTMERAQQAGLTNKPVWKNYPANLLKARCITEVSRDACPEVLAGVSYTPEELGGDDTITVEQITGPVADEKPNEPTNGEAKAIEGHPQRGLLALNKKISALMVTLGITDPADALTFASDAVGHEVKSPDDLTKDEQALVIAALERDVVAQ